MAVSSPSKERPVLIFLHLPKTGGSSLREFLKAKCGHKNYYQTYWSEATGLGDRDYLNQFIALPQEERDRFDLIMGHFSYGLHRFLSRPCVYVTLLRNPLERFCSFYLQLLRDHPHSLELAARNYSIEEYLQDREAGRGRFQSRVARSACRYDFHSPWGGGGQCIRMDRIEQYAQGYTSFEKQA